MCVSCLFVFVCVCVCVIHNIDRRRFAKSFFFSSFIFFLLSFLCIFEPQNATPHRKKHDVAAANSAAYWRIAGMSYLKYANACAEVVRGALKEPHLSGTRVDVWSLFRRRVDPRNSHSFSSPA